MSKTLGYFVLISSALASKAETTNTDRRKFRIAMEVLNKVSVESSETKEFIDEKLWQNCSKENMSIEVVTYFCLTSQANIFYCAIPGFSEGICFIARIVFN